MNGHVAEILRQRRTIYRFRPDPLPPGLIEELLALAVMVPNHRHTEPWRFLVPGRATRERLADLRLELARERSERDGRPPGNLELLRQEVLEPPAIVYFLQVLGRKEATRREDYASCAIAAYIVQLAAWERGVGARWHTGQLAGDDPRLRALLGLGEDEAIVCYLGLGYPQEVPRPWDRGARERTRYSE